MIYSLKISSSPLPGNWLPVKGFHEYFGSHREFDHKNTKRSKRETNNFKFISLTLCIKHR